jgi:hypothetical protein
MCSHLGPPRPTVARFNLHVPGQPSEFQRQIISSAVDLGPQNLEIPDILAPKPAQKLAEEDVLYEVFAGAGFRVMCGASGWVRVDSSVCAICRLPS